MSDNAGKALALFNQFKAEFDARAPEVVTVLPPHIEPKRFVATALVAVKQNPALLTCNRRSLHASITKAAYDELLPDGREGVLIPRKDGNAFVACWQPMVHGIRKRAGEFGLIIDAKVVCRNDQFEWEEGFAPILRHIPTSLDKDPGEMIGAYAIFRRDGRVLHHEVMRKGQILAVKAISKQQNGLMWGRFEDQAWIKTVVRRASKSVPMLPEKLQTIIERHDDFEFAPNEPPLELPEATQIDPLADAPGVPLADDAVSDPYPDEAQLDADFADITADMMVEDTPKPNVTRLKKRGGA